VEPCPTCPLSYREAVGRAGEEAMPNSKDEKGLRGPDKQQRALRDVREGAYDRGRVSRTRGQQSGQSGAEVPESAPPAETVPGTASKLPEGLQRPLRGPYNRDHGRNKQPHRRVKRQS